MARRAAVVALGAVLLVASGCRHPWFSRCGSSSGSVASTGCRATDPCCDPVGGMVVSGPTGVTPGTLIPGGSVPLVPGGSTVPPPNELPLPGDLIPRPGVPFAPPSAAPGGTVGAGQPVRK